MEITKICANLLLVLAITSCTVHKSSYDYVQVYKQDGVSVVLPVYIILKSMEKTYELYTPAVQLSTLGSMQINGDTIHLIPKFEYNGRQLKAVDTTDISFLTVPLSFIKQKNQLLDITDFKKYPELMPYLDRKIYDNFKLQKQ